MKSFTDIFIRRPVLAIVVNLVIIIAGVQALSSLNVRQYPKTENASITVTTVYVGADAELVRGFITTPLERAIAASDGVDYIESSSSQSVSTITARLRLNYDATKALSEISSKIDQVRGDLPPSAEVPIINIESADSRFASAYLSFRSDILKQNEITDYLSRIVQPRITALEGVQRAEILGARIFAARIWLKPDAMASLNISPSQVRSALAQNNFLSALGKTKGSLIQINLTANTDIRSIDEFRDMPIKEVGGTIIRLGDIADVSLGAEDYETEARYSGETATFMGVWALPNANSIDVIKRVKEEMIAVQSSLPEGIVGEVSYDATEYINNAIDEVVSTLIETLIIVAIVIFLFLGSIRSVLVPLVAIPLSLIGAVFIMQLFGFSLNLLTLLAIVLSVGLVVDDAIVVVENVERNLALGKSRIDAAIEGVRELVGPIIAITITLIAVYVPIGIQGGLTGSLFREFAFTLTGAVFVSGIVALTLSPMMSAKLLTPDIEEHGLAGMIARGFKRLRNIYAYFLDATLSARPLMYVLWVFFTAMAALMYMMSPRELAPVEDQGVIFGIVDAPSNGTIELTKQSAAAVNEVFMNVPEARFTFQLTFAAGGFGGLVLEPWDKRDRTVFEIMPEVQAGVSQVPGVRVIPITPASLPGAGDFAFQFIIASTAPTEEILAVAEKLQMSAMQSGMFAFGPLIDVKVDQPQSEVVLDRDKIAAMGLSMQQVGSDLSAMLSGGYVNRFNIDGRSYKVIPQIKRMDRLNPDQLASIHVTGPNGQLIPLDSIATVVDKVVPRALKRMQQLNAVTLSGVPIRPLDEVLTFLEDEATRILPSGYVIDYTGESRQLREEGSMFLVYLGLSVVLIFLVLAAQFNSFRDPFIIILGSVPLAMFGALAFTFLRFPNPQMPFFTDSWTTTLNIYSQVGLVTLVGLVAKNGILMVEFANQLKQEGMDKLAAIREASLTRLRPVLMTSVATVLGHFPLTLVSGAGAEARNSIGLVLVGGMAIGTVFTLFFIPPIYMLIAKERTQEEEEKQPAREPSVAALPQAN